MTRHRTLALAGVMLLLQSPACANGDSRYVAVTGADSGDSTRSTSVFESAVGR